MASSVTGGPRRWHAEFAWLARGAAPDGLDHDVLIEAHGDRFTTVTPETPAAQVPPGTVRLPGLTLPGLANAHSHAFHRALRGAAGPGPVLRARPRRLRGDGAGGHHVRRRVSLPASWPGGNSVFGSERARPSPDRSRFRRGVAHHAA